MRSLFESNASTNKTIARLCEMVKTETISHEGNDDPTWAENVVKTLAKRLKKAKYLDELAKAIITEDRYSNCCAIPNDVDKKKTLRKNQSHLLYIKLWRFPWLNLIVNCVRCVMRCRYPFSKKADLICINPYHYEPIHAKAPPLPPIVVNKKAGYYHTTPATINALSNRGFAVQPYDDWKSGGWSMRTMAWKDDLLAMGDAEGRVVIWDLGRRQSRHVRASRFPVMRMTFSRLAGDHTLAVLYQRNYLYGIQHLTRQHQVTLDSSRSALDMDLCGVSPLLLTNDNVLPYAPGSAKNSPMLEKVASTSTSGSGDTVDLSGLKNQMLWSRFIGDVAIYNLLAITCSSLSTEDEPQLPPDLQMFWPSASFRERELRVTCAACGAANVEESRLVERAVVSGGKAKERAVDRLIGSTDLRHASMKAALLVSSQECEQARSLIILIATNLIASDMIEDGVELLFLVKAGGDACKYLQSQRQWNKSIVYAKMGLEDTEDVLSKWITHLSFE
ncbi:hypothetical protein V3C99_003278 [Haemonchus contortus]